MNIVVMKRNSENNGGHTAFKSLYSLQMHVLINAQNFDGAKKCYCCLGGKILSSHCSLCKLYSGSQTALTDLQKRSL